MRLFINEAATDLESEPPLLGDADLDRFDDSNTLSRAIYEPLSTGIGERQVLFFRVARPRFLKLGNIFHIDIDSTNYSIWWNIEEGPPFTELEAVSLSGFSPSFRIYANFVLFAVDYRWERLLVFVSKRNAGRGSCFA